LEPKPKWREEDQLFKERKEYELDVRYGHVIRGLCFSHARSIYLLLWLVHKGLMFGMMDVSFSSLLYSTSIVYLSILSYSSTDPDFRKP
jgi:hypothetical protein